MLIEAYGVPGMISLSDRFDFDFLSSLITQTAEMRKTEEDREKEILEQKQEDFMEKNINRSVNLKQRDGTVKKVNLSQFAVSNKQLLAQN